MSVPKQLKVTGAVSLGPIQPTSAPFPSGQSTLSLNLQQTVTRSSGDRAFQVDASITPFDLLAGTGITSVKYLLLRVTGGTLTIRASSPAANDQDFTVSDKLEISNPLSGSPWTALSVQAGIAYIEILIAGD